MNEKVSIIIPVYNKAKYVSETIQSALNQTYDNIEIVIVNDGSVDNSSEIIKDFVDKNKNILFFNEKENKGVVHARNMAIDAASGEYILPLDADDTIEPTYIEKAIKILTKNPDIGIVYCKARKFGRKNKIWKLPTFDKNKFIYENCIFCSALFRKKDFLTLGKYKPYMQNGYEDWDLWLSFVEADLKPYRIDEVLFNYRQCNEKTRSDYTNKNKILWLQQILKNHINLYLNNFNFIEKVFFNTDNINRKYKKYKKLFNISIFLLIIETVLLVYFIGRSING